MKRISVLLIKFRREEEHRGKVLHLPEPVLQSVPVPAAFIRGFIAAINKIVLP